MLPPCCHRPRRALSAATTALAALLLAASWSAASHALSVPLRLGDAVVGSLDTLGPSGASTPSGTGGVNFWAHWSLLPGSLPVEEADLRWLQRVTFSKQVPGFSSPNRPFIDPQPEHSLGYASADMRPWYDISGSAQNALSLTGGGDDPWMGDGPFAPLTLAPLVFTAETLVVAVNEAAKQAVILGGAQWGYALAVVGAATPSGPTALADSAALRDLFNAALAADFPGWALVAIPEPTPALLLLVGLLLLAHPARRRIPPLNTALREASRGSRSPHV